MQLHGVNLGGWLVLERWMTPSLFDGMQAQDEYDWMQEKGTAAADALARHQQTYITDEDLAWLASQGVNALRLPVPHWALGNHEPYLACMQNIAWLLDQAGKHGIKVLLDLHTVPGSQNGESHSGRKGSIGWPTEQGVAETLNMLRILAERFGSNRSVFAIELVNEPASTINHSALLDFYRSGIQQIRSVAPGMGVVISDAYRPHDWLRNPLSGESNVYLDVHLYQAFGAADQKLDIHKHIKKARHEWGGLIADLQKQMPVIVGEWSLGLDQKAFRGMDDFARDKALQAYATAQLDGFSDAYGQFFWSYKTETMAGWSYREARQRGWLPKMI